jgi:hypothetical protein
MVNLEGHGRNLPSPVLVGDEDTYETIRVTCFGTESNTGRRNKYKWQQQYRNVL